MVLCLSILKSLSRGQSGPLFLKAEQVCQRKPGPCPVGARTCNIIWEVLSVFIQTCAPSPDFFQESYPSTRELLAKGAHGTLGWGIGNNTKTKHRPGLNVTSNNESSKT